MLSILHYVWFACKDFKKVPDKAAADKRFSSYMSILPSAQDNLIKIKESLRADLLH